MYRLVLLSLLGLPGTAQAQPYPFVGTWESNGNGCGDGAYVFEDRGFRPVDGYCRFTKITPSGASTFRYSANCNGSTGRYATSGSFTMRGSNVLRLTDKDGPSDWTRCL